MELLVIISSWLFTAKASDNTAARLLDIYAFSVVLAAC
jgi:hypothetical protein